MDDLLDDIVARLDYRIAYGEAARLLEISRFDHTYGRDAAAGVKGQAEDIEREVVRRLGPGVSRKVISLAVEDVMERRRPRW